MLKFTLYNPQTGEIALNGMCPNEDCLPEKPDGFEFIFGVMGNPETQRMVDGKPIAIPDSEKPVTTDAVDAERNRRIGLGFKFGGKTFQVNVPNITGALASATAASLNGAEDGDLRWSDPNKDFEWIAMDNTYLKMDARTTMTFGQVGLAFNSAMMTAGRAIKNRVLAGEKLDIKDDALWLSLTS